MKKNYLLLFSFLTILSATHSQVTIVDNPANFPLDDNYSGVSTESDRFGDDTYIYAADNFSLATATELESAIFFGEKVIGSYETISAFSIYIMENSSGNEPNINPNMTNSLVHLERVLPGQGVEVVLENSDDEMDIAVDFTVANQGAPVVLPAGDYWLVAAVYSPDAAAGDPTLSWQWRFSMNSSTYTPLKLSNQFSDNPSWEPFSLDGSLASSLSWKLVGDTNVTTSTDDYLSDTAISVYPTPSIDIVNIALPDNTDLKNLTLFNSLGRKFIPEIIDQNVLDVSRLASGIYVLIIETSHSKAIRKIIKY